MTNAKKSTEEENPFSPSCKWAPHKVGSHVCLSELTPEDNGCVLLVGTERNSFLKESAVENAGYLDENGFYSITLMKEPWFRSACIHPLKTGTTIFVTDVTLRYKEVEGRGEVYLATQVRGITDDGVRGAFLVFQSHCLYEVLVQGKGSGGGETP